MIEDIENKTNEELVKFAGKEETVLEGRCRKVGGFVSQHAQAELTRRLINSINSLDKTTSKYSKILIWLTIGIGILAIIQIYLLIK